MFEIFSLSSGRYGHHADSLGVRGEFGLLLVKVVDVDIE